VCALGIGLTFLPCLLATKMFRRLNLPVLERLSLLLRVSICVFYGVCGLPIPFRQKLSYVMGSPIFPPGDVDPTAGAELEAATDEMYQRFCDELLRIFDRHTEAYGWGHKSLHLVSR